MSNTDTNWTDRDLGGKYFCGACIPREARDFASGWFHKTNLGVQCDKCGRTERTENDESIILALYGCNNLATWAKSAPDNEYKASFREWFTTLVRYPSPYANMTLEDVYQEAKRGMEALYARPFLEPLNRKARRANKRKNRALKHP